MSVPPDIMALLQGGGGGAPPDMGGGGLPPELLAALGAGGEPEAPAGALHGGAVADGDPEEEYRQAVELLEAGVKEDVDEARIQTILQCITKIQGELANSQKGQDSMLGGKMDPGAMRRMSAPDQAY